MEQQNQDIKKTDILQTENGHSRDKTDVPHVEAEASPSVSETSCTVGEVSQVETETVNADAKLPRCRGWWGRTWRVLLWLLLTPIALVLLLAVLIYIPPVQKWAVDQMAEYLSEEMDMQVTVDNVRLKFPLDLSMGGMTAIQQGDTVVHADELGLRMKFMPLLKAQAEVDEVYLHGAKINTRQLVEACRVWGKVDKLEFNSHTTDLSNHIAVLNELNLKGANLHVALADSVPEDTTESEPVIWKIDLRQAILENVSVDVALPPSAEPVMVAAYVGKGEVEGFFDLSAGAYNVNRLVLEQSAASYADLVALTDMALSVDSLTYRDTGDMSLSLQHFEAKDKSGLSVTDMSGRVSMDSKAVTVKGLRVVTDESSVNMTGRVPFNFADSISPGTAELRATANIGKQDILRALAFAGEDAKEYQSMVMKNMPNKPLELALDAKGNMQDLQVENLQARVDGLLNLKASGAYAGDLVAGKVNVDAFGASAKVVGNCNINTEEYEARVNLSHFNANRFVKLPESLRLTGNITAEGRGFDLTSTRSWIKANLDMKEARYGKFNASNSHGKVKVKNGMLTLDFDCNNPQLNTTLTLQGHLAKNNMAGTLNIDLPYMDAQGLGLYDSRLVASTDGVFEFSSNMSNLFKIDSHVNHVSLLMEEDSIITDRFDVYAETTRSETNAVINTGDLSFEMHSPNNLFTLISKLEKVASVAQRQYKKKEIDIEKLKAYMPVVTLSTASGMNNPLAVLLRRVGVGYSDMAANIDMSPELGVVGNGHIYNLHTDSLYVDSAYFNLAQEGTRLAFTSGVNCPNQERFSAFSANIEGYVGVREADAHLTYFNAAQEKGIDMGVNLVGTDSSYNYTFYPERPIIAFRKFDLNEDNYIIINRDKSPIRADIRLKSLSDDCSIDLSAGPDAQSEQQARVLVSKFNLADVASIMPMLPKLDGMLNVDAVYNEHDDNFRVGGDLSVDDFAYEGMDIGNLHSLFTYTPEGEGRHGIDATLDYDDIRVAKLQGIYDAIGSGALNADLAIADIPLSLASPFIPDQMFGLRGALTGNINVAGPLDRLNFNGNILTEDVFVNSDLYSVDLRLANDNIPIRNSVLSFDHFNVYGAGENPLEVNGTVNFADLADVRMALGIYGKNFKLIEAKRTGKAVVFGNMYGDFYARLTGSLNELKVRGMVNVLSNTDMTYILTETPLSQGDRLDDIVTFTDFSLPPDTVDEPVRRTFTGVDMNVSLTIQDGAKFNCEFSADRQSYVNVQGGGTLSMKATPEGVLTLQGRYTINEGEMKYTLPVIPLKTFTLRQGSYIDFTGDPMNPTLNIAATERTKSSVSQADGTSRSVAFDVGLKITNTLKNMGLEFTIEAPEDLAVQNELAGLSLEEKNKLAVALLATGMYLSSSNSSAFTASNALNNFLQNEINNIAGQALATAVDVNVGMEQTKRDDGSTRTDYSFKFSKRFFSDRLNVIIGGKVSADGNTGEKETGAYIDDVSLEWRLDKSGGRYVRLFHEKDYSNLIEGELEKNGAGMVLRRTVDKFPELFMFKTKKDAGIPAYRPGNMRVNVDSLGVHVAVDTLKVDSQKTGKEVTDEVKK